MYLSDCAFSRWTQEWDGDTADGAFSAELVRGYDLVRRVPLPRWEHA